jgi:hypothetical protein
MAQGWKKSKRLLVAAAALPLLQVGCTTDALVQALATELTLSTAQFVFDTSQIVFQNFLGL